MNILDPQIITYFALSGIVLLFIFTGIKIVPDGNCRVVERLGRRHKVLNPGINIIIPILDKVKKSGIDLDTFVEGEVQKLYNAYGDISLAEQRLDPPPLNLYTKDNTQVVVDPMAYFKIIEPMKAVYDVRNFLPTLTSIIETTLRQEVGKYDSDTIITSRETLGDSLRAVLLEATLSWGIEVIRVEIEQISFNSEVAKKLSEAREEELVRRAELVAEKGKAEQRILAAEAEKKSLILIAEGKKQSIVLEAQGKFEQQKLEAEAEFLLESRKQEGEAKGLAAVAKSLSTNQQGVIALEALKAQEKVAESLGRSNSTIIVPAETAGLFGAFASLIEGLGSITDLKNAKK